MDSYRQHELPETVKRYKRYTSSFQEWLMRTAVQRGVESAAQIAEQAKTKKKGKKAYKISTEQQQILVDGIADSKEPLSDASGLRDLKDAIRSRKEVTQYHKLSKTFDAGHAFFNVVMESAQSKLTAFISHIPVMLKSHDLEDEASTFAIYRFQEDNESDDDTNAEKPTHSDTVPQCGPRDENRSTPPKSRQKDHSLSEKEAELRRDFLALCFLYELNSVREIVREIWMSYRQDLLTAITAALVTDLAQSYIQQNIAALVEDLASYDSKPQLTLSEIVRRLFTKLSGSHSLPKDLSTSPGLFDTVLRHLLCINAIGHLEAYMERRTPKESAAHSAIELKLPFLPFLLHFDAVRRKHITLPIWDKFTESMIQQTTTPDVFLPFGFQIVLDVHEIMQEDCCKIFRDITEYGFDIAKLIRTHVDYEDHMWESGNKPDYMSMGNMKFTNVYLSSLDALLNWIQEVLKTDKALESGTGGTYMATDAFVTMHPTLAGLSIWNFSKTYHGFSISKVNWFITTLCHLYNATLRIGGLDLTWPDLDYIIEMHGPDRIFVGGPPTDPKDFRDRYYLSICVSSRSFAKDYKLTGDKYPTAPLELRKKLGFMSHFPLEDAIAKYYGPDKKNDRWLKRHAILSSLHEILTELPQELIAEQIVVDTEQLGELRDTFGSIATKIMPPKTKNRRKKSLRIHPPDFTQTDNTYPSLLRTMRCSLQDHELHSNFDYLGFYRRAYGLVLKIRKEVLFGEALQLARRGDVHKDQNPTNVSLLTELFQALNIKPKDKKIESTGEEVSTDVVPLNQLKRIAEIIRDTIREEGSVELDRAQTRLNRDWDGLKAAYAADEAKDSNKTLQKNDGLQLRAPRPSSQPEEDTIHAGEAATEAKDTKDTKEPNVDVKQPIYLPPGYWPTDLAAKLDDGCDAKVTIRPGESGEIVNESHLTHDSSKTSLKQRGEKDVPEVKSKHYEIYPKTESLTKKLHQAYVVDEADEELQGTRSEPTVDSISADTPADRLTQDNVAIEKVSPEVLAEHLKEDTKEASKHSNKPTGVFHRLVYSRNALRKHLVIVTGTSAAPRLASTRRRKGYLTIPSSSRKSTQSYSNAMPPAR